MAKSIIPHTKWSASKTALLNLLIEHGGQTIAELSNSLGVSVPYTTKTLNELIEDGLIEVTGKKDNYSKRAPKIYDLIATSGYFLGIDKESKVSPSASVIFVVTWWQNPN